MAAKLSLKLEYHSPFVSIALHSSLKGYSMAWTINKQFGLDLERTKDFRFLINQNEVGFAIYGYYCHRFRMNFFLVENKNPEGIVINRHPVPDFLLLIWKKSEFFDVGMFQKELKKCPGLQATYIMDEKLEQKNQAFFHDLELFLEGTPQEVFTLK